MQAELIRLSLVREGHTATVVHDGGTAAQHPAHAESVDHRQHQIEDDEVGPVPPDHLEGTAAHGGTVTVTSEVGTGSVFALRLPATPAPADV